MPNLVSISPSSGSSGGTLLTVIGTGFGVDTQGVNLVDATGQELCQVVTVTGYGTFTCLTKSVEVASDAVLSIKTASGTYACANTLDATACKYVQVNTGSPTLTSLSASSATQVDITGENFPTSGFSAVLIINGVQSSSSVTTDASTISVTFDNGVPVTSVATSPSLRFVPTAGGGRRLVAVTDTEEQQIAF